MIKNPLKAEHPLNPSHWCLGCFSPLPRKKVWNCNNQVGGGRDKTDITRTPGRQNLCPGAINHDGLEATETLTVLSTAVNGVQQSPKTALILVLLPPLKSNPNQIISHFILSTRAKKLLEVFLFVCFK